jgi:hypothetical protein
MLHLISPTVPGYSGGPLTPEQIGQALACVRRWNGGTVAPWSVLQHSAVCAMVAAKMKNPVAVLYASLHDAEEIFTGDTPRPYKTDEQGKLGDGIRNQILAGFHLPAPWPLLWEQVKAIDDLVGNAERHIFVHPRLRQKIDAPDLDVCDMIWDIYRMTESNPWSLVNSFTKIVYNCLASPEVQAIQTKGGVV